MVVKSEEPSTGPWETLYFIGEGEEQELYIIICIYLI